MQSSLELKLQILSDRHEEISALLSAPEILQDQDRFRTLSKEYAKLEEIVSCFHRYQQTFSDEQSALDMRKDSDPAIQEMAEQELKTLSEAREHLSKQLKILLLPEDPHEERNVFLEIRAGTGGDEAALFAGDLFRMYSRYAEKKGWEVEILSESPGEYGGYKEIISRMIGAKAYSQLKFESGVHRVQRIPTTESQGRVHTSACTVAILPEVETVDNIIINPADLKIDTFRASGAGGQHINKTDSAIRITHLPSGLVVECQDERSQHKNRARAMSLLQARLLDQEQAKVHKEQADTRKKMVGTGDRSERIRTYNFPQGRLTDHRINVTLYKLSNIMEGDLDAIIEPLLNEYQAQQLAELASSDELHS